MSAASPQVAPPADRFRAVQRLLAENPAIALSFIFVALFVVTDIVNRAQSGKPFLTPTQVSTTFLYAAPLALLAAGQTLVMLTGGVDLSVATTATTAAFVTSGTAHDQGTAAALLLALGFGFGIGLVNGIGVAILLVYALCGAFSAVAGILLVGFNDAADLGIAAPFLLPSVAAVVIGGTSILGGSGGYSGTILGALILTVLDSLLTILNASAAVKQM